MARENIAFTNRVIRRLQDRPSDRDSAFVGALTHYLLQMGRIGWCDGVLIVVLPGGTVQVAVWLI